MNIIETIKDFIVNMPLFGIISYSLIAITAIYLVVYYYHMKSKIILRFVDHNKNFKAYELLKDATYAQMIDYLKRPIRKIAFEDLRGGHDVQQFAEDNLKELPEGCNILVFGENEDASIAMIFKSEDKFEFSINDLNDENVWDFGFGRHFIAV